MVKLLIAVALVLGFSTIAISQEAKPETKIEKLEAKVEAEPAEAKAEATDDTKDLTNVEVKEEVFIDTDWMTKLGGWLAGLYLFLWGLGELLTRVSVYTKNKWDNKAAAWISQILWFMGSFAGRMGWKLPKHVIMSEADKIKAKDEKKTA